MNILVLGSGGREHALAWKIKQSELCKVLYVAPGNPGTAALAHNAPLDVMDFDAIANFCVEKHIGLVVVGPEAPLAAGIRDALEADKRTEHVKIVGPSRLGARLESSKDFSKRFMLRHGIPTPHAQLFTQTQYENALQYVAKKTFPLVIKADGLANGKGVLIAQSVAEAEQAVRDILIGRKFGEAGNQLLVEDFLDGVELSVFILTDGASHYLLPEAKDYKRIGDNNTGLNTGGMGSVSPVPFMNDSLRKKITARIITPTLQGLQKEGIPYRGFLFIGLMIAKGEPYVIEYNVRMGDPETQSVMCRFPGDIVSLLEATATAKLAELQPIPHTSHLAVTVTIAAAGYPGEYAKGKPITIRRQQEQTIIFHAGTKHTDGAIVTDGGRVLSVTGIGFTIEEARRRAYSQIEEIDFEGQYFRRDIGLDLLSPNLKV